MIKRLCTIAMFVVIVAAAVASAGEVMEVQVLEGNPADPPATQPGDALPTVPDEAKALVSIEALAEGGGDFRASCTIGERIIHLAGSVMPGRDGQYRVRVDFSDRNESGVQQVASNIVLPIGEQKVIGGLAGGNGLRVIVLTIRHEQDSDTNSQ